MNALRQMKRAQIFWDIVGKMGRFYPSANFKKLPNQIVIELTNACNLRCPVCPTHFAMKRARGFMDLGLYKSIIDEFKNKKIKPEIVMTFAGEPLLHPEVDKFTKYATENEHKTLISTNATRLSKDLSERLIRAGLSGIHLCLEGITKESHEAYRRGSNFEVVKKNIEDFITIKEKLAVKEPQVVIQTLLTSFSENEVDDIIKWAKDTGANAINFKTLGMGSYTTDEMKEEYKYLLPTKKEFLRKISNVNRTLCSWPLRYAVVYWNGELGLCCIDFDNVVKLGNIKEKGFLNTFFLNEVIKKRKIGFRKSFGLCKKCSLGNADFMGLSVNLKR